MLAALTGNFGTGKSTVLALFRRMGAQVISADEVVRELYGRDDVRREVAGLLGDVLLPDGTVDRPKVARLVFGDPDLRERLEAILHPLVFREIDAFARRHPSAVVIAEIPLLFETGREDSVDAVVLTTCPARTVVRRLLEKGFSEEEVRRRLSNQMPDSLKIDRSDFVINTDGPADVLETQVRSVYTILRSRFLN